MQQQGLGGKQARKDLMLGVGRDLDMGKNAAVTKMLSSR